MGRGRGRGGREQLEGMAGSRMWQWWCFAQDMGDICVHFINPKEENTGERKKGGVELKQKLELSKGRQGA